VEALAGAIQHSDEITGASYAAYPHECAGLEIVDYFLWALQRAFERKEERFYQLLAPAYHRIVYMSGLNDIGTVFDVANPFDVKKINT
jgi:hypothetical protein